jgi:membrane protein YqaA with SNARE-associated domain
MQDLLQHFAGFFFALGGLGLLLLGLLDSSFLMLPIGNDLLMVALTARQPAHILYYAVMAAAGSVGGVAVVHWVSSRTGQKAIEGEKKSRQVAYVERQMKKYGGLVIGFAALAPPGFPFTVFIVAAAALQYPLKKMLAIIGVCRLARFLLAGWLATIFGKRIIEFAKSPFFQGAVLVLVAISIVGSAWSVWKWIQKGRRTQTAAGAEANARA